MDSNGAVASRVLREAGLPDKAIHGGKTKNDRLDSYKIASLLRGGNLPYAYIYPR